MGIYLIFSSQVEAFLAAQQRSADFVPMAADADARYDYSEEHDMDLNAGLIITGEKTINQVGEEAFKLLLNVLSGRMTKNEALGYFGSMDIFCLGPVI